MTTFLEFLAYAAEAEIDEETRVKHLPGKHDQKRHGWRFGSIDAARRSMKGQRNEDEPLKT